MSAVFCLNTYPVIYIKVKKLQGRRGNLDEVLTQQNTLASDVYNSKVNPNLVAH
jgi:hypothetical protein